MADSPISDSTKESILARLNASRENQTSSVSIPRSLPMAPRPKGEIQGEVIQTYFQKVKEYDAGIDRVGGRGILRDFFHEHRESPKRSSSVRVSGSIVEDYQNLIKQVKTPPPALVGSDNIKVLAPMKSDAEQVVRKRQAYPQLKTQSATRFNGPTLSPLANAVVDSFSEPSRPRTFSDSLLLHSAPGKMFAAPDAFVPKPVKPAQQHVPNEIKESFTKVMSERPEAEKLKPIKAIKVIKQLPKRTVNKEDDSSGVEESWMESESPHIEEMTDITSNNLVKKNQLTRNNDKAIEQTIEKTEFKMKPIIRIEKPESIENKPIQSKRTEKYDNVEENSAPSLRSGRYENIDEKTIQSKRPDRPIPSKRTEKLDEKQSKRIEKPENIDEKPIQSKRTEKIENIDEKPIRIPKSNVDINSKQSDRNEGDLLLQRKNVEDGRKECTICGRFFASDRLEVHVLSCAKMKEKRPKFDSSAMRKKGTELDPKKH